MTRRWIPLLVAAVLAAGLAVGTTYLVNRAFQPQPEEPVQLRTVPVTALTTLGVTTTAARVPAYCGVVAGAAEHGMGGGGIAGCPISREAAEAAARQGSGGKVSEAVLARVTSRQPTIGSERLVWLVVVQNAIPPLRMQAVSCPIRATAGETVGGAPSCAALVGGSQLVFVDAHSAKVLMTMSVGLPPTRVVVPQGSGVLPPTIVPVPVREGPPALRTPS